MEQVLTLNPARMRTPSFAEVDEPDWAALLSLFQTAAANGEMVKVTTSAEALSPSQFGARMGMSRATVRRLIESGELRAFKVGTHWRISAVEADRYHDVLFDNMMDAIADDLEADLDRG
jgi:excisionase family DNA binding protein